MNNKQKKANPKRILFAVSEVYPLIKTGGLADVACYLPITLASQGFDIRIVLPAYRCVMERVEDIKASKEISIPEIDSEIRILKTKLPDNQIPILLVDIPELFDRPGGPYQDPDNNNWPDNAHRFAIFCRVIRLIALNRAGLRWRPDLVHCNDWHTGLVPALMLDDVQRPATVFTIHNLAYQGDFSYETFKYLKLPDSFWSPDALEFYGRFSFIKGSLTFADRLVTVSPEYAQEITTAEFGYGMEDLLQHRADSLVGILNGAGYRIWDPRYDPMIKQHYWLHTLEDKIINKRQLQLDLGLHENSNVILLAYISRLTRQKGIDIILGSLTELLREDDVQLVILGTGESHYEKALHEVAGSYGDRLAIVLDYNEVLAHKIQAGADMLLMPSRYEPCGLTQLYSLRYGTIPIVRNTGGLKDTIVDANSETMKNKTATGFKFKKASPDEFLDSTHRALKMYRSGGKWRQMIITAMQQDFNWADRAKEYASIYLNVIQERTD